MPVFLSPDVEKQTGPLLFPWAFHTPGRTYGDSWLRKFYGELLAGSDGRFYKSLLFMKVVEQYVNIP